MITTISSNEVTKANRAPEIMPGAISGIVILKKVLVGLLPKLAAARVMESSKPDKVAVTVITTNGVPKIIWASTTPVKVDVMPNLASEKKIATAEIINGTIMGEIRILIISALYGI